MAHIPSSVTESAVSQMIQDAGLRRIHQGKVRDTYELPGYPGLMMPVATDRASIFDFVLPTTIKGKGEVLVAMTVFWLTRALFHTKYHRHHLVAHGRDVDCYMPRSLKGKQELWHRALVVRRLDMLPVECIVRDYLTGSGWRSYQRSGQVCGIKLPEGLRDGDKLPEPIFTPTTKAEAGHDEDLNADEVERRFGSRLREASIQLFNQAQSKAGEFGLVFADTKFEFGLDGDGNLVLGDEVLTPDSSRLWVEKQRHEAVERGETPKALDKEYLRDWGRTVRHPFGNGSLPNLNPQNEDHLAFVDALEVPGSVGAATAERYFQALQMLTGFRLGAFQEHFLH